MFSFLLRIKRAVQKVLKVKSESRQRPRTSFHSRARKFLMLALASLLIGVLYPGDDLYDPLDMPRRGEIAREDVIAEFPITVYKTDRELEQDLEVVRHSVPYIIDYDSTAVFAVFGRLERFFELTDSLRGDLDSAVIGSGDSAVALLSREFPGISRAAFEQSLRTADPELIREALRSVFSMDIYRIGVLPNENTLAESPAKNVLIRFGERETIVALDRLITAAQANARMLSALNRLRVTDSIDVEYCYLVGHSFIRPNLSIDHDEYIRRLDEDLAAVSNVKEVVNTGDIVVRSGHRVSVRQERVFSEMARILRIRATQSGWLTALAPALARILLVLAALGSFYLFLYFFRREIYHSNPKLLAIFLVFALQLFLIHLVDSRSLPANLYPIALLPMMVTILFDAEVGVLATISLAMLLGMMNRFDFGVALLTTVVGSVACFTSRRVRHRSDFFKIGFYIAVAYGFFIFMVESLRFTPADEVLTEIGYGVIGGAVSALLTIGLLPVFESIFGITTDITLLELSDMNNPLLKRLAIEAPGTYQHSIVVGNLSEAAAKAIGANSLLTRVGAYYHDIGKVEIPEYFIENQLSVKSKHEPLSPSVSSLILASHVKRGRLLGEDAGIPDDVLNFIEEHHGMMMMSFFYNKAKEQGADESVADKFRYPGPRPQIRETGVAMLADAVEAASRTLDDPKPARIQSLIQRIINDRFQSGELDECPLTLRDLARIKDAFAQVLIAAFHHRVKYPGQRAKETEEKS